MARPVNSNVHDMRDVRRALADISALIETYIPGSSVVVTVDLVGALSAEPNPDGHVAMFDGSTGTALLPSGAKVNAAGNFTDVGGINGLAIPSTNFVGVDDTQTLTNKTLTAPTMADFTNANHDHLDADDGGTLTAAAIASGLLANARIATGTPDGTKFLRDDQVWAAPSGGASAIDDLSDVDTTTAPPNNDDVLKWNGANWVPAVYNATFAFSISSFSDGISDTSQLIGSGTWMAIGGITFTASYANAPGGMTASVAMSGASSAWAGNLTMSPTTGPETNTEAVTYPSTTGGTVTFTLSQSADGTTDTESVTFDNTMRYGTNANGIGSQTEANIEALSEVAGPSESRDQTISNISTGTAGHYLTFSHASRLSSVAQVQMDSGYGFVTASFNSTATTLAPTVQTSGLTTVTNSAGYVEAFEAITSRLADLPNGSRDFKLLTSSTAQNYIYYGGSTLQTGWTEAQIKALTDIEQVASNDTTQTFNSVTLGASEYFVFAYPSRLTDPSNWFDNGTGFPLSLFSGTPETVAITNDAGYTENYDVWVSNNILGPGAFQLRTT